MTKFFHSHFDYSPKSRWDFHHGWDEWDGNCFKWGKSDTPVTIALSSSAITENIAGASAGKISVEAHDKHGKHGKITLSVNDDRFEIVKINGSTYLKLKPGQSLDYEDESHVAVKITATDGPGHKSAKTFTIAVKNVNEAPTIVAGAPSTDLTESTPTSAGIDKATVLLTRADPDGKKVSYDLSSWTNLGNGTYAKDGAYGRATLDSKSNTITYVLDNTLATTDGLTSQDTVTEKFNIGVTDGKLKSSTTVTFTIHGADESQSQVVELSDVVAGVAGHTTIIWSTDGSRYFIQSNASLTADDTDTNGYDLYAFDPATGVKTLMTPTGVEGDPYLAGITPGGTIIIRTDSEDSPDSTNDTKRDVYSYDAATGTTTLLTSAVSGGMNGESFFGGLNLAGTGVFITSTADLVAGEDDGGLSDVFLHDLGTGMAALLTKAVTGGDDGDSYFSGLSPDGSNAIFRSNATLTVNDTNTVHHDLFVYDLVQGTFTLVTASISGGREGFSAFAGWRPGSSTIIVSSDSSLTPDDTNGSDTDLFAYDVSTGSISLLTGSVASGTEGLSFVSAFSRGGEKLVFGSQSTLTANDTSGDFGIDLFAYDFAAGTKTLLTGSVSGGTEGSSSLAGINHDGSKLIIASDSTLTANDVTAGGTDLFAYDFATGLITLIAGSGLGAGATLAGWSPDGTIAIIRSDSALTASDTDGANSDIFAYDFLTGVMTHLTESVAGGFDGFNDFVYQKPSGLNWSADGNSLRIASNSALTANDLDGDGSDFYWVDVRTGAKTIQDLGLTGSPGERPFGQISADGSILLIGLADGAGTDYYLVG